MTAKGQRRKAEVFEFVRARLSEYGVMPSVREICEGVGLRSTSTAHGYLKQLEEEGLLPSVGLGETPLQVPVLGLVTAGQPILATQELDGYIPVERSLARGRELFALRVRGDSMVQAAILDGDTVIVERTPAADNGEIVVAMLEDEATVKTFFREGSGFRLQPENDSYQPIYTDEVTILGRVVGVWREL